MKSTLLGISVLLFTATTADTAFGAWSLSTAQRRQYLEYYAPLIMKRAYEANASYWGWDWLTNFDFDRNGRFDDNDAQSQLFDTFVTNSSLPAFANWKIRPTLYSSIIEFMEGTSKSVILIYHVYHAKEEDSVHDWERIEIRVNNVNGLPGSGTEQVRYVVITNHHTHSVRVYPHADLNFQQTSSGKHVMIWQAEWAENDGFYRAELRFVENTWATIAAWNAPTSTNDADVEVNGTSAKKNVHYIFVPGSDAAAVSYWNAQTLTHANASTLAAKMTNTYPRWSNIKRIKYELQDLADILPTHVNCTPCTGQACATENGFGPYSTHWEDPTDQIWMSEPVTSEALTTLTPASTSCNAPITYYLRSRDVLDPQDDGFGYPWQVWFWGTYDMGGDWYFPNDLAFAGLPFYDPATGTNSARPCAAGFNAYWCQHDYYAHSGASYTNWAAPQTEYGRWLPANWNLDLNGGFDGRWVQLFADNP